MKKVVMAVLLCSFFIGYAGLYAESNPAHLDPTKKAYYKPKAGAICGNCYSNFTISGYQLDNVKSGACPYCAHEQNLKEAANRYGYSQSAVKK